MMRRAEFVVVVVCSKPSTLLIATHSPAWRMSMLMSCPSSHDSEHDADGHESIQANREQKYNPGYRNGRMLGGEEENVELVRES